MDRLRSRGDGEILIFGSGQLIQQLHRFDQVDEYRLLTFPVLLGGGSRCSATPTLWTRFELVQNAVSDSGVTINSYRRTAST